MQVLLTGASGLIGRSLIKQLFIDGHHIHAVSRNPTKAEKEIKKQLGSKVLSSITWHTDLSGFETLNDIDAVVNLAGEPIVNKRWSDTQKKIIENSRWMITKDLSDLINKSEQPPEVFISGSAIGFYGRQQDQDIKEDFKEVFPEFSHNICRKWEEFALQATPKTRVCLLRTGIVLSASGGALSKMLLPFKLGMGGPIGDGKHYMSWIHIEDMTRGIMFLLHSEKATGAYNFTAPNPVTNKVFGQALAKKLKRPCLLTTPKMSLRLLLGEMSDLLIYGQKVLPAKLLQEGFEFQHEAIDDALGSLSL